MWECHFRGFTYVPRINNGKEAEELYKEQCVYIKYKKNEGNVLWCPSYRIETVMDLNKLAMHLMMHKYEYTLFCRLSN